MEENLKIKNSLIANHHFTAENFKQIENKGISLTKIAHELQLYQSGIAKTFLEKPATINDGILALTTSETHEFVALFESKKTQYTLEKFVPASGAASRMFKFLSEFLLEFQLENETINAYINRKNDTSLSTFIIGMDKLPFFTTVHNRLKVLYPDFDTWKRDNKNYYFIKILLDSDEFDYANKPKGILPFHQYGNEILTPIDEHLKEAKNYTLTNNLGKLHFTISNEHKKGFEKVVANANEIAIQVCFSEQLKNTDTIAVDYHNNPLLDKNNDLVFRPGGHGALIHNLNNLTADVVFIKNIDNVGHHNLEEVCQYKKVLAGYLFNIQTKIFEWLQKLDSSLITDEESSAIQKFISNTLHIPLSTSFHDFKKESQIKYLQSFLDRPIRVCGMVKNENEPGGGPFWIRDKSGILSLQIVESSQIDNQNENQVQIFHSSTHFNPVDIVCGLKNYKGEKFNLHDFVDNNSGFIVEKSKNGINYKAYELPGLWNGAMAHWITVFIEVPLETFNPVKTVNDLLKYNHQPF